jgi:hypothetical protein
MDPTSSGPEAGDSGGFASKRMTLTDIFKRAFDIYKNNLIMMVPSIIPIAWMFVGMVFLFAGLLSAGVLFEGHQTAGMIAGGFGILSFVVFILGFIVLIIASEGILIQMVWDATLGRSVDLSLGWKEVSSKMGSLVLASIIGGVLILIGLVLFVIPGLILSILFYFMAQAVVIDNARPTEALSKSYRFVRANLGDTIVIVIIAYGLYAVLSVIPVISHVAYILLMPYLMAVATLFYLDRR